MFHQVLTLPSLAAADPDGVSVAQTPGAAGALTITGALASAGAVTFDAARRPAIFCTADESARTFTLTGTDRYGRAQIKTLLGATAGNFVFPSEDFLTLTSVAIDGAASGVITVGTTEVASSKVHVCDTFANPSRYSYSLNTTGTAVPIIEVMYENLAPAWDFAANSVIWKEQAGDGKGLIEGPVTAIRMTNKSGTGTANLTIITPFIAGGA